MMMKFITVGMMAIQLAGMSQGQILPDPSVPGENGPTTVGSLPVNFPTYGPPTSGPIEFPLPTSGPATRGPIKLPTRVPEARNPCTTRARNDKLPLPTELPVVINGKDKGPTATVKQTAIPETLMTLFPQSTDMPSQLPIRRRARARAHLP
ncbi:uncharacterized protein SPPG_08621 [Spizellomyces punctatus DAOM BR117]|uniref:Uncharacterized protein n=1 Tax=Spizellomyces punctatus (strain DAOM BR117) TaxID=645134 RepID=A0A0L0H4A1_SPIPD|nr:uncharacterized protein SPPG_08621 [Spizellomyces punctatus DAOM BR117]KNC96027.1 hypothetical protein SPPG_08621 [Spizellomyces punctatus DAOM BR117]|eukprot:XP_016604067.1 hypothetical protein SPPG_08621 [Spizellomyces punctatus DAOM BR117]